MRVIEVYHGNSERDIEPYNENPEPSVTSWDHALISESRTVENLPRLCEDVMCEGDCAICTDAQTYEQDKLELMRSCRRVIAKELGHDADSVICSCHFCSMELSHPQNDEEE